MPSCSRCRCCLRNILSSASLSEYVEYDAYSAASIDSLKAASVLLTMLPMLLVYPWIQRYFTKGTLVGQREGVIRGAFPDCAPKGGRGERRAEPRHRGASVLIARELFMKRASRGGSR